MLTHIKHNLNISTLTVRIPLALILFNLRLNNRKKVKERIWSHCWFLGTLLLTNVRQVWLGKCRRPYTTVCCKFIIPVKDFFLSLSSFKIILSQFELLARGRQQIPVWEKHQQHLRQLFTSQEKPSQVSVVTWGGIKSTCYPVINERKQSIWRMAKTFNT